MVYCPVMIRNPNVCEPGQPIMNILKNAYPLNVGQRKILAILTLVLAFTNSPVSAVHAAVPVVQASQPAFVQAISIEPETLPVPVTPPTVQEVLLNVCQTNGYGEDCAKTLLGMLWNESSNSSTVIGDNGKARGYFQIHYKLHKISIACAEDLVCSANWTINYLERNSYPKYVNYAVQCHNSCGVKNGYAVKAARHAKLLWDTPLEITQAAPIELAVK